MFNGHKPHHPTVRFFLCFADCRGPGCCCARPINTAIFLSVFALRPAQRPAGQAYAIAMLSGA